MSASWRAQSDTAFKMHYTPYHSSLDTMSVGVFYMCTGETHASVSIPPLELKRHSLAFLL